MCSDSRILYLALVKIHLAISWDMGMDLDFNIGFAISECHILKLRPQIVCQGLTIMTVCLDLDNFLGLVGPWS